MPRPVSLEFSVAVHVLTFLAGDEGTSPVTSDRLAESTGANAAYIRRVLAPLRREGYVVSKPGAHGGWLLAVPPAAIALGALWHLFDGPGTLIGIHGPDPSCAVGRSVQTQLTVIEAELATIVETALDHRTIQTLVTPDDVDTRRGPRPAGRLAPQGARS